MVYARGFPVDVVDPIFGLHVVVDQDGNAVTDTSTEAMLSVLGGVRMDVADRVGIFVQGRWYRAFATGSTNNFGLHAGFKFTLGER